MKTSRNILLIFLAVAPLSAKPEVRSIQPITEYEAVAIVQAREEAKEKAKDDKEIKLRGAPILGTAIADLGQNKVEFNRVPQSQALKVAGSQIEQTTAVFDEDAFLESQPKEQLNFTLSGTVRAGISELWWRLGEEHFKIYVNANFLYLSGWIDDLEDEKTIYSVFPIIIEGSPDVVAPDGEWRPTQADFSADQLEYFIVMSSGDESIDNEALKPIELMLIRYIEEFEQLKITYENGQKMRDAKAAYLEANPPKKRDTIINFAPIDKNARNAASE